jgi:hypothetical protein
MPSFIYEKITSDVNFLEWTYDMNILEEILIHSE